MNPHFKPAAKFKFVVAALFVVACAMSSPVHAQRETPQNVLTVTDPDARIRALEIEATRKRDPKVVMNEINEDFKRLVALHGELKNSLSASAAFNYKGVSETSAEVKKRAARLRTNLLALPRVERDPKAPKPKDPADHEQLKASLTSLSNSINSFLTNPIFSATGAPDVQLATKAGNDLDQIIELSDKTKKGAEKLHKTASKSN